MEFCKNSNTKAYLTKPTVNSNNINLHIFFNDIPGYTSIEYDSNLLRHDYDSTRTSAFIVPEGLLENFKKSIYRFVSFENGKVFFGYKEDASQILARDISYLGIMTPYTEIRINKGEKRISSNAIITSHYLP